MQLPSPRSRPEFQIRPLSRNWGPLQSSCTADTDCHAGTLCLDGTCRDRKGPGETCLAGSECHSQLCVDGVCCNAACDGPCEACNQQGSEGTCTPTPAGTQGSCSEYACDGASGTCPTQCAGALGCAVGYRCRTGACEPASPLGTACAGPADCASGACVDGTCCDGACTGPCESCSVQGSAGTCSAVPARSAGAGTCGTYACDGTSGACPTQCTDDDACPPGRTCTAGACVPLAAAGTACTDGAACQSGFCVDGVCCDRACDGECEACNRPTAAGTCSPAARADAQEGSCGDYVCNGTASGCPTTCAATSGCAQGYVCSAGSCVPGAADGTPCTTGDTCASRVCTSGLCGGGGGGCSPCPVTCASDADCEAGTYCPAPGGSCLPRLGNGSACTRGAMCTSGSCADGVCCNTACSGACDRCNLAGQVGTCRAAPDGAVPSPSCGAYLCNGASAGCPTSCASAADCVSGATCSGGTCGGSVGGGSVLGASCTSGAECASGFCADGVCCSAACNGACDRCNGASPGNCTPLAAGSTGSPDCGAYVCNGTSGSCPTSCNSDSNCDGASFCNGSGACAARRTLGNACTRNTQCVSGFCADNVCCNSACAGTCRACNLATSPGTCADEPNGTSWGLNSQVCCSGSAVDISTSETHCGGCNSGCAAGRTCEPVDLTQQCPLKPLFTTGRCGCSSGLECPRGQTCRGLQPHANRCAPKSDAECSNRQKYVEVVNCPNYCIYPRP